MGTVVVAAPEETPVSLEEAKKHVHAENFTEDDDYLTVLIQTATELVQSWLGRALITQTLELRRDDFEGDIYLMFPPVISITSVKYDDSAGDEQTFDGASYRVVGQPGRPRIILTSGGSWPSLITQEEAVRIQYVAGYGPTSTDVPAPIRHAMLLLIGTWYAQRETVVVGSVTELPMAVDRLLSPYRVIAI